MKVIAVVNQKGGCGKTTTSINLSASLAFLGKKVLLIDLDPQAHSAIGLGVNPEELERSLFDVFDDSTEGDLGISEIIVRAYKNLDLAPSQVILSAIEQKLSGTKGRERKLSEKIKSLRNAYEYIIIDCPPSLGLLTFNALSAADEVLVPVEPSFFAFHGIKKIMETLEIVKETVNPHIRLHALITMYDSRTKHSRDIVGEIQRFFADHNVGVIIRKNIRLQEAAREGKPITEYDKNSIGFKDYMHLAVELIERCGKKDQTTEQKKESPAADVDGAVTADTVNADTSAETVSEPGTEIAEAFNMPVHSSEKQSVATSVETPVMGTVTDSYTGGNALTALMTVTEVAPQVAVEVKPKIDCAPKVMPGGILFSFQSAAASRIEIAGEFTRWRVEKLNTPFLNEDVWTKSYPLAPGKYRYKYIVDGQWVNDPDNPCREMNPFQGEDSIVEVLEA